MHVQTPPQAGPPLPALVVTTAATPGLGSTGPACRTEVLVPGAVLRLSGRLDVAAAADVRMALVDALAGGAGELVVDVATLTGLDATGLGVLVGGHRRAQREGRVLVLRDVSAPVARLLFLTRLDKVLRQTRSPART